MEYIRVITNTTQPDAMSDAESTTNSAISSGKIEVAEHPANFD